MWATLQAHKGQQADSWSVFWWAENWFKTGLCVLTGQITDAHPLTYLNLSLILGKRSEFTPEYFMGTWYIRWKGLPVSPAHRWSGRGGCSTSSAPSWCWWDWACCAGWPPWLGRKSSSPRWHGSTFSGYWSALLRWSSLVWERGSFPRHLSAAEASSVWG